MRGYCKISKDGGKSTNKAGLIVRSRRPKGNGFMFESAMPIREGSSRAADHFERVMRVRSVQLVAFLLMLPHDAFASGARNILSS